MRATRASELLAGDRRRGDGPRLHFSQWREIAATDRAASDLGGAREGGAAGACCALPEREGVGGAGGHFGDGYRSGNPGAAILEMGRGRLLRLVPVVTVCAPGGKLHQGLH